MVDPISSGRIDRARIRPETSGTGLPSEHKAPPVNARKIAAIRRRLATGNYQLDEDAIAAAMLRFAEKP